MYRLRLDPKNSNFLVRPKVQRLEYINPLAPATETGTEPNQSPRADLSPNPKPNESPSATSYLNHPKAWSSHPFQHQRLAKADPPQKKIAFPEPGFRHTATLATMLPRNISDSARKPQANSDMVPSRFFSGVQSKLPPHDCNSQKKEVSAIPEPASATSPKHYTRIKNLPSNQRPPNLPRCKTRFLKKKICRAYYSPTNQNHQPNRLN